MWITQALVLLIAAMLTGCATGPRTIDAEVRTHWAQSPGNAVLKGARYRLEPTAATGQPVPAHLLTQAQTALTRAGAVRDDTHPRVSVQVGAWVNTYWISEWGGPYGGYGGISHPRIALGLGIGRSWRGGSVGFGFGMPLGESVVPVYASEVSLLMRDLQTGQIVYDTRARHDGTWRDTDNVLAALFAAALEGYPSPGQAMRRVGVPLFPPAPQEAAPAAAPPHTTAPALTPPVGHTPTTQITPVR